MLGEFLHQRKRQRRISASGGGMSDSFMRSWLPFKKNIFVSCLTSSLSQALQAALCGEIKGAVGLVASLWVCPSSSVEV